jgi:hypothetical protein
MEPIGVSPVKPSPWDRRQVEQSGTGVTTHD